MNPSLANWLGDLPTWSVRLLFGLTIVWTAAGIAVWLLRRGSAAVRHRTWGLSVVAALVLPLPVLCLPEVRLGWFEAPAIRTVTEDVAVSEVAGASARTLADRTVQPVPDRQPDRARVGDSATPLPFAGSDGWWLIVLCVPTVWGLFQIVRSLRVAGRIVARSEEITDPVCRQLVGVQTAGVQASACATGGSQSTLHPSPESRGAFDIESRPQYDEIGASVGLRSLKAELQLAELQLRQSRDTPVPLCVGLRKPAIILPADWRTWPAETLRSALAHELSHVLRRDVAWQLLARLACAVYWFHPLAWLAARRMRIERETACDDHVLSAGERPAAYARVLVAVAERLMRSTAHGVAAVAMAEPSGLEERVKSILEPNRSRVPVGRRLGRWLLCAALLLALFAAVLNPFSRDGRPESPQQSRWFSSIVGLFERRAPKPASPPPDPYVAITASIRKEEEELRREFEHPATVTGQIVDHQSNPVAGAELRLIVSKEPSNGEDDNRFNWYLLELNQLKYSREVVQYLSAVSDAEGKFEFTKVRAGRYLQIVYWGNEIPHGRSLALAKSKFDEGQSTIIRVPEPASIHGSFDPELVPNAAEISVHNLSGAWDEKRVKLEKGQDKFRVEKLRAGRYSVAITGDLEPGLSLVARVVTIKAGKEHEFQFTKGDLVKRPPPAEMKRMRELMESKQAKTSSR